MLDFNFQEYCCGCGVCENICPTGAIKLQEGESGFLFINIDKNKCVNCKRCDSVCVHMDHKETKSRFWNENAVALSSWIYASKNREAKLRSSSGAAFYDLAEAYIKQGNFVSGCVWDENLCAVHILGNSEGDIIKMQGSKYVQSRTGDIYQKVLAVLKSGRKVLFSGTPCQTVAVQNYVTNIANGKYLENLLTVAIICHGVPSPKSWESFKEFAREKYNSDIIAVNFRDKSKEGYKNQYCKYEFKSGEINYTKAYLPDNNILRYLEATIVYNLSLRNSCTHCDCKGISNASDLIIGDCFEEFKNEGELGTSCIVACTEKGYKTAMEIYKGLKDYDYKAICEKNPFIIKSVEKSFNRDRFIMALEKNKNIWENVENFYPNKYRLKKVLVRIGLFGIIKRNLIPLIHKIV